MVNFLEALSLGLIQGVTEWLPISSSGHLALAQMLFGIEEPVALGILLHLGSLLVILFTFRERIFTLIKGILNGQKKEINYLFYLFIASLPIALIGFFFNNAIKAAFSSLLMIGFSFLITAFILSLSFIVKKDTKKLNTKNTLIIGLSQALALLPGVSRSGSTISTALILGIDKKEAATFAFLLFIPAILGATVLEFSSLSNIQEPATALLATLVTIISGYLSLRLLLNIVQRQKLHYFAPYCLTLAIISFVLHIL